MANDTTTDKARTRRQLKCNFIFGVFKKNIPAARKWSGGNIVEIECQLDYMGATVTLVKMKFVPWTMNVPPHHCWV